MTDTKFTPGPWAAELGEVHEVRDAEGGRVCILTQLRGRHGLGGRRPDHESPANARLIAAAPEMYDALQTVSNLQRLHYGNATLLHLAMIDAAKEIDAALAKAVKP